MDQNSAGQYTATTTPTLTRGTLLRRTGLGVGAVAAAATLRAVPTVGGPRTVAAATRSSTPAGKPTLVLVHGAWADGSSWGKVIQLLQAAGYPVVAVQLELASLGEDIALTRNVLAQQTGPTVLAGHSYGGMVITGAAAGSAYVQSLVYVAAFAPDEGETILTTGKAFPPGAGLAHLVPDYRKGFLRLDPAAYLTYFMPDVAPAEARALAVTQQPLAAAIVGAKMGTPAWRTLPSWYLVATHDQMINPAYERMAARRMGATTTEVASSHVALLSHPHETAALIMAASQARAGS
jgi:pimeloyl-ACP methyl ester carboxylesterase